jgi:acetylornithine deacetylase/succinyl-diaminopimelate desuccinylase-like protein
MKRKRSLHRVATIIEQLDALGHAPTDVAQEACRVVLHVDVPLIGDDDETDAAESIRELLDALGFDCEVGGESE